MIQAPKKTFFLYPEYSGKIDSSAIDATAAICRSIYSSATFVKQSLLKAAWRGK